VWDAVVAGGGPAGSVCAARLAAKGRRVVVLERARHPRFHLGESLLPCSMGVLEAIGVLEEVRATFLVKRGARFVDGAVRAPSVRYSFAEAFAARWDHAFEVPRDSFDAMLFRRAGALGAELREGWEVTRVVHEGEGGAGPAGRALGVEARDPSGARHTIEARVVVDATGRDALTARAAGDLARIPHLDRTALFAQVRGAWRDSGEREGDIQIVVFGEGDRRGWFWLIPFSDGRSSVGAVVSSAWLRERREAHPGPEQLFHQALRETPAAQAMLDSADYLFAPRATTDFSFRVGAIRGDGWLAVGDAGGFLDPLFSTGAHLAMNGGLRAADAVDEALAAGDVSTERFAPWDEAMRAGADLFLGAVQAFYGGELVPLLFAQPQHPFLRRAITSLLAGDVFEPGARWAREVKARFPVRS
jgi:flavin-dependent dehydrogenase